MESRRAPQGIDVEDKLALGLSAPHLLYLVVFAMSGWALFSSPLPGLVRFPFGALLVATGVALAWGRVAGRPLDTWLLLYVSFLARPRRSPATAAVAVLDAAVPAMAETPVVSTIDRGEDHGGLFNRRQGARRCAFFSLAGGSGKSTLAVETAALVATTGMLGVAVLELDGTARSARIRMGLDGPVLRAASTVAVPDIERCLLRHESGVRVLVIDGGWDAGGIARATLVSVLSYLDAQGYELVVIDGCLRSPRDQDQLNLTDDIFYVFNPTPGGVFDLYQGVATLRRAGLGHRVRAVVNRADSDVDLAEVIGDLRVPVVASVATMREFADAEDNHVPAVTHAATARLALGGLVTAVMETEPGLQRPRV